MKIGWLTAFMFILGGVGGLLNAFFTDNGFIFPRTERIGDMTAVRPGVFGNIIVGAVAAVVFWGLYGPFANMDILDPTARDDTYGASPSQLVTSILIGIGGARVLSAEVDKKLLKITATKAANSDRDPDKSNEISAASPAQSLEIAKKM
jgi:hypothetical protein